MMKPFFISAIGTPLTNDERLHDEGLARHLEDQWSHGINGVLVGGTMGLMQMLRDETYTRLARRSVELSKGKGEVLVGAGDAGFARTADRIAFLNDLPIDGIVVLTPYFLPFSQTQLVQYFTALADVAKKPLYLYDLPGVTNVPIAMDTYMQLAKHPNIRGAKVSGRAAFARELIDRLGGRLRIIVAEPTLVDVLLRHGIEQHLDGMYAIAPQWTVRIGKAVADSDWETAAAYQRRITTLRNLLDDETGGMGAFTAMMNARGIPGSFASAPFSLLSHESLEKLLAEPIMRELVAAP
jgi:4-hydroxy-tetrahydrodipicolinate synthase